MMYKAKAVISSQNRTKHSTQSEQHVELLNVKPGGRGQLKPDGTRWRTVGEVKGKHASGVGSQ